MIGVIVSNNNDTAARHFTSYNLITKGKFGYI